GKCSYVVACQN
ncbi:hypothetical protein ECPA49_5857, partial [Escherichia coli PA49]